MEIKLLYCFEFNLKIFKYIFISGLLIYTTARKIGGKRKIVVDPGYLFVSVSVIHIPLLSKCETKRYATQ